jgi:predicted metal-dependent phosphoesterase TrpH
MPAGQPFTRLCQQSAHLQAEFNRADLHLHSCWSDGAWTPAEVVERARRRGLGAIAITDHDMLSGIGDALLAVRSVYPTLEVVPGVEVTCLHRDRELHLLGYYFNVADGNLNRTLAALREQRMQRFRKMVDRLPRLGVAIDSQAVEARIATGRALGRFDVAALLVQSGKARTLSEAVTRFLRDGGPIVVPKRGLPVAEAIDLIHRAGGVCSWAHPPTDVTLESARELHALGLDAIEVEYPTFTRPTSVRLRELAKAVGLTVTGGSDCHGPTPATRAIGSRAISRGELEVLRNLNRMAEKLEPDYCPEPGPDQR